MSFIHFFISAVLFFCTANLNAAQVAFPEKLEYNPKKISNIMVDKYNKVFAQFKASCGFELSKMIPFIEEAMAETPFRVEQFLAIMTQESVGNCLPMESLKTNQDPYSHGLFGTVDQDYMKGLNQYSGLNKNRNPKCTMSEKNTFRQIIASEQDAYLIFKEAELSNVNCMVNPFNNFKAALAILSAKVNVVLAIGFKNIFYANPRGEKKLTSAGFSRVAYYYNGHPEFAQSYMKNVGELAVYLSEFRIVK